MKNLVETIDGEIWSLVYDNFMDHDGCVVDLGCLEWNWSKSIIGNKRVIGVDPIESEVPEGAELFRGVLGPFDCEIDMNMHSYASSIFSNDFEHTKEKVQMLSWKSFCERYEIDKVSILKMNIEGSEFTLLNSMDSNDFSKIDQIVLSFHYFTNPEWTNLTKSSLHLLELEGFKIIQTFNNLGWYLAFKPVD